MRQARVAVGVLSGVLACVGLLRCGDDAPPRSRTSSGTPSSRVVAIAEPQQPLAPAPGPALPVLADERGLFMDRLPVDTLLTLRIPRTGRDPSLWNETLLARAVTELSLGGPEVADLLQQGMHLLSLELPAGVDFPSLAQGLGSELVFAVVAVHPEVAFPGSEVLAFTGVLYAEVDGSRESVLHGLEAWVERRGGATDFEGLADGTYRARIDGEFSCFEVLLDDHSLALGFAPPGSPEAGLDEWSRLEPEASLRSSVLLRSMPPDDLAQDPHRLGELFINFRPLWKMLLAMGPPEAQKLFRAFRLEDIAGLSLQISVESSMLRERFRVHAPGGLDLLSRLLSAEVDSSFLRWIPDSVDQGGLFAFDLKNSLKLVKDLLPPRARHSLNAAFAEWSRDLEIDVEEGLVASLGPTFAVASKGSLQTGDLRFTLAIECRDGEKLSRWLERGLGRADLLSSRRMYKAGTQSFFGVPLPSIPGLDPEVLAMLEPSYMFQGDTLLIGSGPEAMRQAITASAAQGRLAPRELAEILQANTGSIWSAGYANLGAQFEGLYEEFKPLADAAEMTLPFSGQEWRAFCARLGPSVNLSRRDALGLEFEGRSSLGLVSSALLAGGARFLVSVAMPNVIAARSKNQEAKVVALLREVAAAQRQLRSLGVVDADSDGAPEYASLAELAGLRPLRGRGMTLSPALLDPSFGAMVNGCVRQEGYLLRLSLPDRNGLPQPELSEGGTPRTADPDGAEWGWVVYAWPETLEGPSRRVFVIDQTGEVFVSDNDGKDPYVGMQSPPPNAAAYLKRDLRARGVRSVRRGLDGALWLREH